MVSAVRVQQSIDNLNQVGLWPLLKFYLAPSTYMNPSADGNVTS